MSARLDIYSLRMRCVYCPGEKEGSGVVLTATTHEPRHNETIHVLKISCWPYHHEGSAGPVALEFSIPD